MNARREFTHICNRDRLDNGGQEVDHDNETHRETAEATEPVKEYQLAEVVYCRVDPATTLRQQHLPVVRCDSESMRITNELSLEVREMFEE